MIGRLDLAGEMHGADWEVDPASVYCESFLGLATFSDGFEYPVETEHQGELQCNLCREEKVQNLRQAGLRRRGQRLHSCFVEKDDEVLAYFDFEVST